MTVFILFPSKLPDELYLCFLRALALYFNHYKLLESLPIDINSSIRFSMIKKSLNYITNPTQSPLSNIYLLHRHFHLICFPPIVIYPTVIKQSESTVILIKAILPATMDGWK